VTERIRKKYNYNTSGANDGDDLAQEALEIAMAIVEKYDASKGPLYNFLSVSVGNRIKNFIRNKKNREIDVVSIMNIEEETIKVGNMKTTYDEFWKIIDENLSADFRSDYLKLRQGISITKHRKVKLMEELRRIVNEFL
jgi:DNA-directed RNA polymerase specialized sigma24 family protein